MQIEEFLNQDFTPNNAFRSWLRYRRKELGLSQAELAIRLIGSDCKQSVSQWETGESRMQVDYVDFLAEIFQLTALHA